ncbi:unnamed protein product [Agarophyton chilense]|eukprot:gb/GEZJ01001871.1/.p1 GENE.gb/GEZJ01001871.1/~~gb/GEZJ01001871.1/.p1  ORF type:complete len:899 (+),score=142.30 gb/GEZJ01001871.1/:398-3094(+)
MEAEAYDLKQQEDGSYQMHRQDHRLHVGTGEEAQQQWPDFQQDEEAMPVLDLPEVWSKVIAEEELKPEGKEEGDVFFCNAKVLVAELKYHILASARNARPAPEVESPVLEGKKEINHSEDLHEPSTPEDSKGDNGEIKEDVKEGEGKSDEYLAHPKSVYGASIMLKLQWEDKTPQKKVPHRTYEELGHFIGEVHSNLLQALQQNKIAGGAVVNVMAFDLTPLILARYMEGVETCTKVLEENAFKLLTLFVELGNPREVHLAIKTFLKLIDNVYLEAASYLLFKPLMNLWMKLILLIPRMRHKFFRDLLKELDRMLSFAESFEASFVPDEGGTGIEESGRIKGMSERILLFLEDITELQVKQCAQSDKIGLEVDELGRAKTSVARTIESQPLENKASIEAGTGDTVETKRSLESSDEQTNQTRVEGECEKSKGMKAGDDSRNQIGKATTDWVNERAVTLARALQILGLFWADIPPPPGEKKDRSRKTANSKKSEEAQMRRQMRKERKEMLLARCINLFDGLGWSNPVLVCQIANNGLTTQGCSMTDDSFREHLGEDIRSKSERKNTLYSVNGIAQYLCGVLRPKTQSLLRGIEGTLIDHYDYDLTDTAFDLLDATYAFDLILPYAMALISLSDSTLLMAGVLMIRPFLSRLPEGAFETYEEALRLRFAVNVLGREANVFGLALHLVNAIASCDDPKHRQVAYKTLKDLLGKCSHPAVRYTIVECLFQESKRMAVTAQLVTEMKDAVRFSDEVAAKGTRKEWRMRQASGLRTRFVEVCLPKYFTPQRSLLSCISPMVSTSNVCLFLAASDAYFLQIRKDDEELCEDINRRRRFMKAYCKLGMDCVRALASVAEHDQKNVPSSKLAKDNRNEAMAILTASKETFNQCIAAMSALTRALELL